MEAVLGAVESTPVAEYLRGARWSYAAVNAAHILGIALLVGAIAPLNLRLLGVWSGTPKRSLVPVLVPVAATGLLLALVAGLLLFSVRAQEYAANGFLQAKLVLVATGTLAAIVLHRAYGLLLEGASDRRLAAHALLSMACWVGALICGRLIAFSGT